jgi:phenylacetate-CoA ligase
MPTLLHPDDPAFHRMVAAYEGPPEPWLELNRTLRDAMVAYAVERSPYYRAVIRPGMDFEDIPVLTKQTVRQRSDDLLAEGVHRDRWAPSKTSGSTGEPVAFVRDTAQGHLENVSARRFLLWLHGIPPDATSVWLAARPRGRPGSRRGWVLGRRPDPEIHPVTIRGLTPDRLAREARRWAGFRAWFLYGNAGAIGWLADESVRQGLGVRPLAVITTSDTLPKHEAERLTEIFGVPVHSWYGSNEVNGFVAGTLPGSRTYAFNPLLTFSEILDDDGRPASPGSAGRLILTDLNNLVMPLIRYDIGDVAVASDRTVGGFRLVEDLVGRISEVIRLPSGKILNALTIQAALFFERDFVADISRYQCARVGDNAIELRVVWARSPSSEVRRAVRDALRVSTDPDTRIDVRDVETLGHLPSGKVWMVRDETAGAPEGSEAG